MPCYEPPTYFEADDPVIREKLNTATRLACMFCHFVESQGCTVPDWAMEWWLNHQKTDAERRLRDQSFVEETELRKRALSKLTDAERRALGV